MPRQATPPSIFDDLLGNPTIGAPIAVDLDLIDDNPYQPRQAYDPATLEELADSIERNGLQQPPAGRWVDGRMQLVFGHRRKRAYDVLRAKDSSRWSTMPVFVVRVTDENMATRAWTENVERADLTAIEQATAIQTMLTQFGWTQAQVAEQLGLSASAVSNKLRLLRAPVEVVEAVKTGLMSERQAAALAPVWDLPAPALEAARNRQGWGGIGDLIEIARKGGSSDELRQRAKGVIDTQTRSLDNKPWTNLDLGHVARVVASRCTLCPHRILSNGEPRCAGLLACYEAKGHAWEDQQRAALAERAGVPALPSATGYNAYEAFYGDNLAIVKQGGLHCAPLCDRLRVKPPFGANGLRLDGCDEAELVCSHGGAGCSCLQTMKREFAKDRKAQWKLIREQTRDALIAALLPPSPDTLRIIAGFFAPYDKRDQVANWRIEDAVATIVKALMEQVQPYDPDNRLDESRAAMEKLLARGKRRAPWTLPQAPDSAVTVDDDGSAVSDQPDDLVDIPTPTTPPRPFPSTKSLQITRAHHLHELLSGEPQPDPGYIVPTADREAPDYIGYKLERISNWIAKFQDPSDGLPTPESVSGNFDNLERLRLAINNQQSEADAVKLTMLYDNVYTRLAALSDRVQQSHAMEADHA